MEQQHPHQQSNIQEHRLYPPQSPTTPSWNIADKIVKDDSCDEKNEDSGVSPGHYTSNSASPRSRGSSSVMNCSLSPGSSISDSQSVPGPSFEYSPHLFKRNNSPLTFESVSSMDANTLERKNEHHEINNPSTSKQSPNFQCTRCIFSCSDRLAFTEHLLIHYGRNETSEFQISTMNPSTTKDNLNGTDDTRKGSSTISDRSENEYEDYEDVNTMRVNSQGKVKTHKCRQCDFVSYTKLAFWQHGRVHIKADKLLTCPRCPFITEYKHHLEYHLRNHFKEKPFKCSKCSYSCVNKSMLNSHLKSHSNIYQYRCANCSYATKYCHSLKLHLRKYNHQPDIVLNLDGSPNPLPIIDVYGTRRGPKSKPVKNEEDNQYSMQSQLNNNMMSVIPPPLVPSQLIIPTTMSQLGSPMNMAVLNGASGGINAFNGINNLVPNHANMLTALSYNQFMSGYPIPNSILNEKIAESALQVQAYLEYARSLNSEKIPEDLSQNNISTGKITPTDSAYSEFNDAEDHVDKELSTTPKIVKEDEIHNNPVKEEPMAEQKCVNNVKKTGTSRRKGKAVKLDKHILEKDSDDEQDRENFFKQLVPKVVYNSMPETKDSCANDEGQQENKDQFRCQFCDISFGSDVMYTVHMGYHGYHNPFTCNMCGHQCSDKLSFFLHIAKSKH